MFLDEFSKYFTKEGQKTELYRLWSSIGVNMEKAMLEEFQKIISETTDIMSMNEDTLRSWLAFFFAKIPCCVSATVHANISVTTEGLDRQSLSLPKGTQLVDRKGHTYTQMENVTLTNNTRSANIFCVQGKEVQIEGYYNNMIRVQAQNPDLSYLTVKLAGEEINELSYANSYNSLTFAGSWNAQTNEPALSNDDPDYKIGWFYTVNTEGSRTFGNVSFDFKVGDCIVYTGKDKGWMPITEAQGLNYIQWNDTYLIPSNGYFAYYFGGYLYIKIFPGNKVQNPEGLHYVVTYISSDGESGNTPERTDTDPINLTYAITPIGSAGRPVTQISITNAKSSQGVSEIPSSKLGLYLKQKIFSSVSICTVSQYTDWFRCQPEVGDCIVVSDFELEQAGINMDTSGKVLVYLLDPSGNNIENPSDPNVPNIWKSLYSRIQPYKDIAVLEHRDAVPIYHFFQIEYKTSSNNAQFEAYVQNCIRKFYTLSETYTFGDTLFSEMDITKLMEYILQNDSYDVVGLKITGYYYGETTITNTSSIGRLPYPDVAIGDGFYLTLDENNDILSRYDEFEDTNTTYKTANIYLVNRQTLIPVNNQPVGSIKKQGEITTLNIHVSGNKLIGLMRPKDYNVIPSQNFCYRVYKGCSIMNEDRREPEYIWEN